MSPAAPICPPSAIRKVTAVLEALADQRRGVDIARTTGYPTSTVHRILQELVSIGWAREDDDHGYSLGPRLLSFAGRAPGGGHRQGRPQGTAPAQRPHRSCRSSGLKGRRRSGVHRQAGGPSLLSYAIAVGLIVPIHSTGIGNAMLAAYDDDEVRAILDRAGMPARTEHTFTDIDRFLAELATGRRRGYTVDFEENELHTRCVAAPVLDHRGKPVAAVSVSALAFDMDQARMKALAPLVNQAALEISEALGGGQGRTVGQLE